MITPTGRIFFIEFKRAGAKPTPAQDREHARLKGHNVQVFVVDSIDGGRLVVDMMLGAYEE